MLCIASEERDTKLRLKLIEGKNYAHIKWGNSERVLALKQWLNNRKLVERTSKWCTLEQNLR